MVLNATFNNISVISWLRVGHFVFVLYTVKQRIRIICMKVNINENTSQTQLVLCLYIYCTLCLNKRLILSMPIYYCSSPLIMPFPLKAIPSCQVRFHMHWNSKILLYCPLREAMPHISKRCHCRRWPYKWGTTEFWCCNTSTVAWDDITLPYSPYRILQMECLHAVYSKLITLRVFTVKDFDPTL